jgi:hypothetical protein
MSEVIYVYSARAGKHGPSRPCPAASAGSRFAFGAALRVKAAMARAEDAGMPWPQSKRAPRSRGGKMLVSV